MKIAHILWLHRIGGTELFALRLALQQAHEHDVTVIYLAGGNGELPDTGDSAIRLVALGCHSGFDLGGLLRLAGFLRREAFDVLHQHQSPAALPFVRLGGRHALIVKHEHGRSSVAGRAMRQRFTGWLVKRTVDLYIANSEFTRGRIVADEGVDSAKTAVVTGGLEPGAFVTASGKDRLRAELGIGPDKQVILFLGRLVWEKGVEEFVRVAQRVAQAVPESRFLIVGDGPMRHNVQALIKGAGLQHRTTLPGFREDVAAIMACCDLFLMTSRQEAQGLTVLEAMAAGLPVIAFDPGGVPEVVGAAGVLVRGRDTDRMAEIAIELLQDGVARNALVERGRKWAERFMYPAVAERITGLYMEHMI